MFMALPLVFNFGNPGKSSKQREVRLVHRRYLTPLPRPLCYLTIISPSRVQLLHSESPDSDGGPPVK